MESQVKISVIVPIYKSEKFLMQCIKSISKQTLKEIEIILVDEGDDDECYAIMLYLQSTDSRIKVIHEKNGGYGASCNKAFKIVTGEYIGIVESDDFIEPTMYEEMYNYAQATGADIIKIPFYYYTDKSNYRPATKTLCDYSEWITSVSPTDKSFSIVDYPQQLSVHASNWAGLYKTSFIRINNIEFINAKGASYVDVGFRIDTFLAAKKIAWLPRPLYNYRTTNENSSTNNFNLSAMLERWAEAHKKFEENYPGLYEKIGHYSFYDEFLNTVNYFFTNPHMIQNSHLLKLKDNLKHVDLGSLKMLPARFNPDDIINKVKTVNKYELWSEKPLPLSLRQRLSKFNSEMHVGVDHFTLFLFMGLRRNYIDVCINLPKNLRFKLTIGQRK